MGLGEGERHGKGDYMVNNGPFMEFLRFSVDESAANTFTQGDPIQTPNSKTENLAMLIHTIDLMIKDGLDGEDGDSIEVQLTTKSQTAMIEIDDPECIEKLSWEARMTTSGAVLYDHKQVTKFDPPLLYSKGAIYPAIQCTGQPAASAVYGRIGYTLEKVTKESFIDALVEG